MQDDGPILLDTVLRPNPPMHPRTLAAILIVVTAINLAFAISFALRGAWPIAPFMGADVALLCWAFRTSLIAARQYEHLRLTPAQLLVARYPARGRPSHIALNPYWVQVDVEDAPSRGGLFLRSHGDRVQIGSFLAPAARISFASMLKAALKAARDFRPS